MEPIAIAEFVSCLFVGVSIVAQFFADDGTNSSRRMRLCSLLAFVWLLTDGLTFVITEPYFGSYALLYVSYLGSFTLGSVILAVFLSYADAFIREQAPLKPLTFKIPIALTTAGAMVIVYQFINGKILSFANGHPEDTGGIPPFVLIVDFTLLFYSAVVAFIKRKYIGWKAVVVISVYSVLPAVAIALTTVTDEDYSVLASGLVVTIVSELLQNNLINKRRVEAEKARRLLSVTALHEKFRADALDFVLKEENLERFIDFISGRILEIYGCDQVIYRDIEGRMVLKEREGTPNLDFSLCKNCPHYAFDSEVYKDGFTVMDDCRIGYKGIPVHENCRVRASLTWLVHEDDKVFGYVALHYLDSTHHFTSDEKATFNSIAQLLTLVLTRRKHRNEISEALAFTNYFLDTFVSSYSVNLDTRTFEVYRRDDHLAAAYPVVPDYVESLKAYIAAEVHPDDRAALTDFIQPDNLKKILKKKPVVTYSFRDIYGGVEKLYGLRVARGADEHSAAFAFVDYSETAAKEQERQELRHLRSFGKMINAATWSVDIKDDGTVASSTWSYEFRRMFGYTDESDFPNRQELWAALLHPEDRERVLAYCRDAVGNNGDDLVYDTDYRARRKSGEYHWYHTYWRIEKNTNGTKRMYGIVTDVSAEKELSVKNARFDVVKDMIKAGLWSFKLNAKDEVIGVEYSVDFAEFLNVDAELANAGPGTWKTLVHPDDRAATFAAFTATIADRSGMTPYDVVYRMSDKTGKYNWYHSAGRVIRHEDGSGEFFGIQVNITKTIEKEREQQKRIEEVHALERANEAKSYFFSMVSHDIRTPLNAIIGYAELLKLGIADDEERKKAVDSVLVSGHTLLELINDVLDLSKLEAGKMEILPEPVDVTRLVNEVADAFRATIGGKPVEIRTDIEKMPWLRLDPQRVRQILFNLIGNAVKFTEHGYVAVNVKYERGKDKRGTFRFAVIDTGCGISEEDQERVAQPYVQVGIKSNRGKGTGLGLAICKQLVAKMNGEIELESALGKGTTFTVIIPDVEEEEKESGRHLTATQRIRMAVDNNLEAKLHVLIVDDVMTNLMVLKTMLKKFGIADIEMVDNGFDALKKLREAEDGGDGGTRKPFDLVMTDMWMPGMDGEKLVKEIRSNPSWAKLPVYAVTADIEAQKGYASMGFSGIMLKPVTMEKLKDFFKTIKD